MSCDSNSCLSWKLTGSYCYLPNSMCQLIRVIPPRNAQYRITSLIIFGVLNKIYETFPHLAYIYNTCLFYLICRLLQCPVIKFDFISCLQCVRDFLKILGDFYIRCLLKLRHFVRIKTLEVKFSNVVFQTLKKNH